MKVALYTSRYAGEQFPVPPALQYLGGMLRSAGIATEDEILFADSPDEAVAFAPDIFGVSSVSQTIGDASRAAQQVRSACPHCWTVLGGYHVSALPSELPSEFDLGVLGEGEDTLAELALLRSRDVARRVATWQDIQGICFRDSEGKMVRTANRLLRECLDDLPEPLYRLPYGSSWAYLNSSRGCPYHCRYCASQSFWGRFRAHSANYLVNQVRRLIEDFGAGGIYFVDDLFIAPPDRLKEFHRLLKQEGLLGRVGFKGFVRVNPMSEEVVNILKEIGFTEIRFGMETASPRLLQTIKDQPFSLEKIESILGWCDRAKLPVCASFMFGLPGEEEADIEATRQFLRRQRGRIFLSGCYLFQPVPGSDYWNEFLKCGKVSPQMDFSTMQLDLTRTDLDWSRLLYVNESIIPRERFRELTSLIVREFARGAAPAAETGLLRTAVRKGKNVIRRVFARAGYEIRRLPSAQANGELPTIRRGGRVYVGCGEDQRPGYIGCDIRPLPTVSVVCTAWNVSRFFVDLDEIFSRHLLEHLTLGEAEVALTDWLRALKLDGGLHLIVPNVDAHVRQWQCARWNEATWRNPRSEARHAFAGFWGWQRGVESRGDTAYWDVHKSGYNAESLTFLLGRLGYWNIRSRTVGGVHLVLNAQKLLDPGECQVRPCLELIEPAHRARYAFAASNLRSGTKVLDVACGIGYGSFLMAERSACSSVHGMDRNPRALEYAARYYASPKVRFTTLDLSRDNLPAGMYDEAVSFETIEHLDDGRAFLGKIHAALRPGGRLFLSTPNQDRMPFNSRKFPFHRQHFTLPQIRDLLAGAGFSVSGVWSQPERSSERLVEGASGLYLVIKAEKRNAY